LAVLQLDPTSLYREKIDPLPLADQAKIKVGTQVVAIGSPIGLTGSMTEGIISQIDRIQKSLFFPNSWVGDLIQTDAPINHGNSGGPLLNLEGEVVGVNDRGIFSDVNSQSIEPNIGLAISAGTVKRIANQIIANVSFNNPYLGVVISDIPPFFPERVGLSEAKGAYILSVIPDGPASKVQIESNNVIIKVDDLFIRDKADLINYIQTKSPRSTTMANTKNVNLAAHRYSEFNSYARLFCNIFKFFIWTNFYHSGNRRPRISCSWWASSVRGSPIRKARVH
jgi:S1-C subfamily serine protease